MGRAAFFLLTILAFGCAGSTPPEPTQPAPLSVTAARVQSFSIAAEYDAGGTVRAKNAAAIASRILAPVLDVRVRAGARVAAGDTLIALDARELQAQAARASAALAAAKDAVRAAESERAVADAALRLASATFERTSRLYTKGVAAGSELDEATAALDTARARVAGVNARAAEAAAALRAAEETSSAATIAASYAVITAPFSGLIAERLIDPGAMAVPGTALLRVEDTSLYRLEVSIDEARAHEVAVGQTVRTTISGASDTAREGRVSEVARLDPSSHSFVVKIDLPSDPSMRSGLFGRARLRAGTERILAAPATAVIRRGQMSFVFVIDQRGVAHLRLVTTGRTADGRAEVLAGLEDGEMVVDHPSLALTDGARVTRGAVP